MFPVPHCMKIIRGEGHKNNVQGYDTSPGLCRVPLPRAESIALISHHSNEGYIMIYFLWDK